MGNEIGALFTGAAEIDHHRHRPGPSGGCEQKIRYLVGQQLLDMVGLDHALGQIISAEPPCRQVKLVKALPKLGTGRVCFKSARIAAPRPNLRRMLPAASLVALASLLGLIDWKLVRREPFCDCRLHQLKRHAIVLSKAPFTKIVQCGKPCKSERAALARSLAQKRHPLLARVRTLV